MSHKNRKHNKNRGNHKAAPDNPLIAQGTTEHTGIDTRETHAHGTHAEDNKRPFFQHLRDWFDTNKVIAIFTAVIAFVGLLQWDVIGRQLTEMGEQRRISVRPWVAIDDEADPIQVSSVVFDKEGNASIEYAMRVKNYSPNPAQNVMPEAELLILGDSVASIKPETDKICSAIDYATASGMGNFVFPGKNRVIGHSTRSYPYSKMASKNGKFQAWLVGCVGYRDQFGHPYHTKFQYWLTEAGHPFITPVEMPNTPNTRIDGTWMLWGGSVD